jgi:Tol biopolymer transport system component
LVAPARWREDPFYSQPTRVTVTAPGGAAITRLNLSPDGRRIAFAAANRIFVRALNSPESLPLEGTEGAGTPFWSPDGRFLAFPAGGKLKVTEAAGGPPRVLCEVNTNIAGAWGSDGTIVIGLVGDGLFRIPADGGRLTRITELDRARGESRHLAPQFLPGSRKFLFVAGAVKAGESMLNAGSLDSSERMPIMPVETNIGFVPAGNKTWGYLIFGRAGMLLAQPFDVEKLRAEGEAFPILDSVRGNPAVGTAVTLADFSVAGGALAYRTGSAAALARNLQTALNPNAINVIQNWMAGLKR